MKMAVTTTEELKAELPCLNYYYVAHSVPIKMEEKDWLKKSKAFTRLNGILASYPKWWHYIDGFWVIGTEETMDQVRERLQTAIPEKGFFVFIGRFHGAQDEYTGFLPKESLEYLATVRRAQEERT